MLAWARSNSGNLSAWTSTTNDADDLSAGVSSVLKGTQGLQAMIDDNKASIPYHHVKTLAVLSITL